MMRPRRVSAALILAIGFSTVTFASRSQAGSKPAIAPASSGHVVVTPSDVKWGPAPPVLPPGAQVAVLDGNPFGPGFFSIRLRMPDGYRIPPHWHPTDENVVVIQGMLRIGMGDKFDEAAARELPAGGFVKLPKGMHHFAGAKGETIVQIYGDGPFVVNYINPADDPSRKSGSK